MDIQTAVLACKWNPELAFEIPRQLRLEIARRAALAKDILLWGQMVMPQMFSLNYCKPLHSYFVEIRYEAFTDTLAPRYHSKTTVKCILIPMFQGIYEPDLYWHYLNVQATDTKANAINRTMMTEFEENDLLNDLVGDMIGPRWNDKQFVLKSGPCFSAVGAGQSIRGIIYRARRPDYLLVDDLYNEDDIHNPEATKKKNEWFWSTLYPARAQGRKCSIHVQGTSINEFDLYTELEKARGPANEPLVKSKRFQAIPDYPAETTPLWPEKNTYNDLMRDKALMSSSIWMREMQNEPRDDSASLVKRGWIKEYDPDTLVFDQRYQYRGTLLGVDPSIGEKSENDYTGIALIRVGKTADQRTPDYYVEALWNDHLSLDQRILLLQAIQDRQPGGRKITLAYIEGIAGFIDFVRETQRRTSLPVRLVDKVPDKLANLETKAWFWENGRIFLNKKIDPRLKEEWTYQLTTNHPMHDDLRDATLLPLELPKLSALAYAD